MLMFCYNSQLTTAQRLVLNTYRQLGDANLHFAQSVLGKFRVDATTQNILVGPVQVWIRVASTDAFHVK